MEQPALLAVFHILHHDLDAVNDLFATPPQLHSQNNYPVTKAYGLWVPAKKKKKKQ